MLGMSSRHSSPSVTEFRPAVIRTPQSQHLHCTSLTTARFRQITQFPTDFCRGRHFPLCLPIKGRFGHLGPPDWGLCRFIIPVHIRVLGQVPSHHVLRCGAPNDPHTSSGIMGSILITDPRGNPPPPPPLRISFSFPPDGGLSPFWAISSNNRLVSSLPSIPAK